MPGVVGHRRVTDTVILARSRWGCKDGGTGQEAMSPSLTSVSRGRPADVGSSTIKKAARLEGSNDRVAKGKGVRLNLRLVITGFVGVGVAANLDQRFRS